ncbi:MAG: phage tail tube protein [Leucobacter sp.]
MSNRVPLPAGTTLGKSFEYGIDVNLGLIGTPQWQPCRRISAFAPTYPAVTEATTTYDDLGAPNDDVTGRGFATAFTIQGNRSLTTGLYLPELEAILAAAKSLGEAAVLDVRWYHKPASGTPNPNDAGRALVRIEASRQNTGDAQNEIFAVTMTGKGEFEKIANPFGGWGATAPEIASITPNGAAAGELVVINGAGLLGVTAVTFDGDAAEDFTSINASSLAAILPVGDAGTVPVVVTSPAGASAPFAYTRAE